VRVAESRSGVATGQERPLRKSAYRNREQIIIVDDQNVGIDPSNQTLLDMGLRCKLSRNEWIAVSISLGMGTFGAAMIILAIVDPDPTSKLGLLIGDANLSTT
jgi:hypothetical protein